ncbi:hypothetical protein CTAYLR_009436 [Chrysophaeum taylorii]|uniref:Uncharacterized protein n=1 Tax=Chrysophaeum taylorii TaxID=2483200 RepID=A0AAD7UKG8_9STRA|nr:hypothetical protein CTAYLR_009436 [Chrysophaeum taylorii]
MSSFPARLDAGGGDRTFATVWSQRLGVERILSYKEFAAAVASGAAALEEHSGAVRSERVAFLAKGTLDFYVAIVSVQAVGATPVLLNWRQPVETLAGMIYDARATILAVGAPYHQVGQELATSVRQIISIDNAVRNPDWTWSVAGATRGRPRRNLDDDDDEAAVFFTSGSTSRPKPVLHTNGTLMWTADNFVFPRNSMMTTTTLCFMPNFHVLMCFQNFWLPMARGVGVSIHGADATDPITADLLLRAATDLRPSTIDTVPFIMREWAAMEPKVLGALAACAAVRSGGAPLSTAVAQRLVVDAGIKIQSHYGQTEAPGMQLLTVPNAAPDEIAVFRPPWSVVEIELDGGGDEGELLIRGCKGSSPGYLKAGALVPGSSRVDGWHRTGDVFRRVTTRSGEVGLEHVSRVDDTILLSTGEMFNPNPVEAALLETMSSIIERAVVLGQNRPQPALVVELKSTVRREAVARSLLEPRLAEINARQPLYARIGHVVILLPPRGDPELPHSVKGGVIRVQAEKLLASRLSAIYDDDDDDQAAAAAAAEAPASWWFDRAFEHLKTDHQQVDSASSLEQEVGKMLAAGKTTGEVIVELGLDSVTAARLAARWRLAREMKPNASWVDRLKARIVQKRPVAGRPLATIIRNEVHVRWYRAIGLFEGLDFGYGSLVEDRSMKGITSTQIVTHVTCERGALRARVYRDSRFSGRRLPCVLEIPGDAFFGYANPRPFPFFLVRLGFAVAQAERRGSHEGGAFPGALVDVARALRAIRDRADDLGVDPTKIAVFGESSGGWFSSMLGALSAIRDPEILGGCDVYGAAACVVAYYPPTRFDRLDAMAKGQWLFTDPHDDPTSPESLFLGSSLKNDPAKSEAASAATYVNESTPPFFLIHGDADPMIHVEQSRRFFQALVAARGSAAVEPPDWRTRRPTLFDDADDNKWNRRGGRTSRGDNFFLCAPDHHHEYLELQGAGHATAAFSDVEIESLVLAFLKKWLSLGQDD